MSTTAIIIEFLIVGIQAALWLTLLIATTFGFAGLDIGKLKGYETLVATILVPTLYPIGMFIDSIADSIFMPWTRKIASKHNGQSAIWLAMTVKEGWLPNYIDFNRAKLRVLRSSAFNFIFLTLIAPIFIKTRLAFLLGPNTWKTVIFSFIFGLACSGMIIYSWYHVSDTFFDHLCHAYEVIQAENAHNEERMNA